VARRTTYRRVLSLLSDLDPYGLTPGRPGGAPKDEYDIEARPMALRLVEEGRITLDQVDAIWLTWFGDTLSTTVGRLEAERFVTRLCTLPGIRARRPPP
jgi:hypothetical protein